MSCLLSLARALMVLSIFLGLPVLADTATFSEKYADKLFTERYKEGPDTWTEYWTYPTGSFSFSGNFFIAESPAAVDFNEDSAVAIQIGSWFYEGTLGDDDKYVAGKSSASFALVTEGWDKNDNEKLVKVGKVSIKFTKKGIKITVSAKTGGDPKYDAELAESPIASEFQGEIGLLNAVDLPIMIMIGEREFQGMLVLNGKGSCKIVTKKIDGFPEEYELCTVTLKGKSTNLDE